MKRFFLLILLLIAIKIAHSQSYNGIYHVGGNNPYFTTLNAAIDSLVLHGISNTVILRCEKSYTFSDSLIINQVINGSSLSKMIIIENANISYAPSVNNFVVKLKNTSFIQFRNCNIYNTNTSMSVAQRAFVFDGTCTNISIDSCSFYSNAYNVLTDEGALISALPYSTLSFIKIQKNSLIGGSYGFFFSGTNASNISFRHNYFSNFLKQGLFIKNFNVLEILNNQFFNYDYTQILGINLETGQNINIQQNKIQCIDGIKLNQVTQTSSSPGFIVNNMIYSHYSDAMYEMNAIQITGSSNINIDNNTVLISGSFGFPCALKIDETTTQINLRNNIIFNKNNSNYPIVNFYTSNFNSIDHNCYYSYDKLFGVVNNVQLYYLQWINQEPNFDKNSLFYDITFVVYKELFALYIDENVHTVIERRGMPLPHVTTDIDGVLRDPKNPDIGADEGDFLQLWLGPIKKNTVWTGNTQVLGNVKINTDDTLFIKPEADITLLDTTDINCYGTILSLGNQNKPITIQKDPIVEYEPRIRLLGNKTSKFAYCIFNPIASTTDSSMIYLQNSNARFDYCLFEGLNTLYNGGCISSNNSNLDIHGCIFTSNNAPAGGAIHFQNSTGNVINSLFKFNSGSYGGTILLEAANVNFLNNTFFENYYNYGSDIFITSPTGQPTNIKNCVFKTPIEIISIDADAPANVNFSYCCFNQNSNYAYGTNIIENVAVTNYIDPMIWDNEGIIIIEPGSPLINQGDPSITLNQIGEHDVFGKFRFVGYIIDIGAVESQNGAPSVNAGEDVYTCTTEAMLNAENPVQGSGVWSNPQGIGTIQNPSSPTTLITGLTHGIHTYRWTVTYLGQTMHDDVLVYTGIADAGPDQTFYSGDLVNFNSYVYLTGNDPLIPVSGGFWSWPAFPNGLIRDNQYAYTEVLPLGISKFVWTIFNLDAEYNLHCESKDTVTVYNGLSLVLTGGELSWSNPTSWNLGVLPGPADSVTLYNVIANLSGLSGICNQLYIGNGSTFTVGDYGSLFVNNLLIEENPLKFNAYKGNANLHIRSGGSLTIDQAVEKHNIKSGNYNGLTIRGGGSLIIDQAVEKSSKEAGNVIIRGGSITLDQAVEKEIKESGSLTIRGGGSLTIDQNVVKGYKSTGGGIFVLNGASMLLEDNNPDKSSTVYIRGGSLTIDQAVEKSGEKGSSVYIRGGSLTIDQAVEKNQEAEIGVNVLNGASLLIESYGNTKAGNLHIRGGSLTIDQAVEKSGEKGSSVQIRGGSLTIDQAVEKYSEYEIGLNVLNGSSLLIENDGDTKVSSVLIRGGSLTIDQAVEKSGEKGSSVHIRGGSLTIDQAVEKYSEYEIGLNVLNGSSLLIENNGDTKESNVLIRGGSLTIDQAVEKSGEKGSSVHIRGGSLTIDQAVEKNKNYGGNLVLRGGSLTIDQAVEKGIPGSLSAIDISLTNGQLRVGSNQKGYYGKNSAGLYCNHFIAEKTLPLDLNNEPDIIIGSDGFFEAVSLVTNPSEFIKLNSGIRMTILEGGSVTIPQKFNSSIVIEQGASLIDMNSSSSILGSSSVIQHLQSGKYQLVSSPVMNENSSIFPNSIVKSWDENIGAFNLVTNESLGDMKGYLLYNNSDYTTSYNGVLHCGNISTNLTNNLALSPTTVGLNLTGNPYPSAIDLQTVTFDQVSPFIYTFNPEKGNFSIFEKNGITLNDGSRYIMPSEGFFVKTISTVENKTFNLTNENRIHFSASLISKEKSDIQDVVILKIAGNGYSDELIFRIKPNSTIGYDETVDAVKIQTPLTSAPSFFMIIDSVNFLSINSIPDLYTQPASIPIHFDCLVSGTYQITVPTFSMPSPTTFQLKDSQNPQVPYDLSTNPVIEFNHTSGILTDRFTLLINGGVYIDNKDSDKITIYSSGKKLFVDLSSLYSAKVDVYDVAGRYITGNTLNGAGRHEIELPASQGLYIVKISGTNFRTIKKVLID